MKGVNKNIKLLEIAKNWVTGKKVIPSFLAKRKNTRKFNNLNYLGYRNIRCILLVSRSFETNPKYIITTSKEGSAAKYKGIQEGNINFKRELVLIPNA
jgi:hypothetical protein